MPLRASDSWRAFLHRFAAPAAFSGLACFRIGNLAVRADERLRLRAPEGALRRMLRVAGVLDDGVIEHRLGAKAMANLAAFDQYVKARHFQAPFPAAASSARCTATLVNCTL